MSAQSYRTIVASIIGVMVLALALLLTRGASFLKLASLNSSSHGAPTTPSNSDKMCAVTSPQGEIYFISCGGIY